MLKQPVKDIKIITVWRGEEKLEVPLTTLAYEVICDVYVTRCIFTDSMIGSPMCDTCKYNKIINKDKSVREKLIRCVHPDWGKYVVGNLND